MAERSMRATSVCGKNLPYPYRHVSLADEYIAEVLLVSAVIRGAIVCTWPCHSPRWWPGKVLAVVS